MTSMNRQIQFGAGLRTSCRSWTADQERRLIALSVEAHSKGEPRGAYLARFADEFDGRASGAINARAHRLLPEIEAAIARDGTEPPEKPVSNVISEFDATLIAMARAGRSALDISHVVGKSENTVQNRLSRLRRKGLLPAIRSVQNRPDMWTLSELVLLVSLLGAGQDHAQIGAAITAQNGGSPIRTASSVRTAVARLRTGDQFAGVPAGAVPTLAGPAPQVRAPVVVGAVGVTGSWLDVDRAMLQAPVRRVPRGLTLAQQEIVVRDHLDFVAGVSVFGNFSVRADLRLCEGLWRAESLIQLAALLGFSEGQARGRWRLLIAPWADDRGHVPLGVADVLLPELRARAV